MNINIHIYQSVMTHESRIFKTSKTVCEKFDKIILLGLGNNNCPITENYFSNIKISRSPYLINKAVSFLVYYFWIIIQILKYKPKVLTIHSLELLPCSIVGKLISSKIIFDAHELETEKNGMGKMRKNFSRLVEAFFIKFCDKVVVVGYEIANFYNDKYNIESHVILNVPYLTNISEENNEYLRKEFSIKKNELIFLYQGLLGEGRGLRNLMLAFSKINDKSKKIIFMGYGPLENEIIEYSNNHNNIYFKSAVSPDELISYTQSADFGISLIENTSLSYYYCLPNKIFEYAQAGIPIIVSENIEMKNIVLNNNIGISIVNNVSSIISEIEKVSIEDKTNYSENLFNFKNEFNWENQEQKINKIYSF